MKKYWIFLLLNLVVITVNGQQVKTEYNKKGDDAMAAANYSDAKMWYEEGVANCDLYSINQITEIWKIAPDMRLSLRSLITRCYDCLTTRSSENDTIAIRTLILYHKEGIGIPQNKTLASYWTQRLSYLSKDADLTGLYDPGTNKVERTTTYFMGLNYSIEAPIGLTFGWVGQEWGGYMRVKSNLSFLSTEVENNNQGFTPQIEDIYEFDKKKVNCHIGTVGVLRKWSDQISTSVGVGYGMRDLLWHYNIYANDIKNRDGWSKNTEASYKGVVAELDLVWSFNKVFVSTGINTMNFKYVDINAGFGIYF